jgi:N-acetyl-anhydromuramoyl-L-alanine amidase
MTSTTRMTSTAHPSVFSLRQGWLAGVRHCVSPNFNQRPLHDQQPMPVDLLVVHNISLPAGQFATGCVEQLFCNTLDCSLHPGFDGLRGVTVSAHFFIQRDGAITQFVATDDRAWHAGVSRFGERENCNDFSIGIELEGTDSLPFTDAQYDALLWLARGLMQHYPRLAPQRIVGHSDIAPGRKTDPGPAFDWQRVRQGL